MGVDLELLARRQLADYDRHEPGTAFTDAGLELTTEEAYRLQIRVAALREQRGERVAGYKVGCVSEEVRRQLGLTHAVFGHIFASELHPSGVRLDGDRYRGLAVEGEIAVRLGDNPPESVQAFPVIELHNWIFRGAGRAAGELIGNNAIHAGVVLPEQEDDGRGGLLSVWINDELRGAVEGSRLSEQISVQVQSLTGELRKFGIECRPGQILLTGSPLPLYRVGTGDRVAVKWGRVQGPRCVIA